MPKQLSIEERLEAQEIKNAALQRRVTKMETANKKRATRLANIEKEEGLKQEADNSKKARYRQQILSKYNKA